MRSEETIESSQPSELELRWRQFRSSIKTEIPQVNFSWDDCIVYKSNRYDKSISPVRLTPDAKT